MTREERMELFNANQGLVVSTVNKHWYNSTETHDDLMQEALMALWSLTETYNESIAAFSTYAVNCIYHNLTNYAYVDKYGKTGSRSNFRHAMTLVKEARAKAKELDEVLREHKATPAIVTYAHLIDAGDSGTVSLSTKIVTDKVAETNLTLGDAIRSDEDLESDVCDKIYSDLLMKAFNEEFVPRCINSSTGNKETRLKLLNYYRERLFGKKVPQAYISEELGISVIAISRQFKRWDNHMRMFLKRKFDINGR